MIAFDMGTNCGCAIARDLLLWMMFMMSRLSCIAPGEGAVAGAGSAGALPPVAFGFGPNSPDGGAPTLGGGAMDDMGLR